MHLRKTITPLLWRVIVFLCFFVFVSGMIGPRIISGGILFRDGFAIYGGLGKALIFGGVAFILITRHKKSEIVLQPWRPALLCWILSALGLFVAAWTSTSDLLAGQRTLQNLVTAHGSLWLCILLLAIGCFGPENIRLLWHNYKKEIAWAAVLATLFYLFLLGVYALWQPLASVVLLSVKGMLSATGVHAIVIPPHTLMFDKFGITVAQYCSGIESIALFTGLYAIVGLLDWQRLSKKRYYTVFPFALLALCALNVIRIYGLILAGYYINPQIAFSLFHTYAGLVFFVLYSTVFWSVTYKYLLAKETTCDQDTV